MPYPISLLLHKIEALYNITLHLTQESEEAGIDSSRQIAIEEARKETLIKADLIFEEIVRWLSIGGASQESIPEQDFLQQKERLLRLIHQIRQIDAKRAALIQKEQAGLVATLQYTRIGKQAVIQYQKAAPSET